MGEFRIINKAVLWRGLLLFFLVLSCWQKAMAHPMPNTIVNLQVLEKSIKGEAKIPLLELESAIRRPTGDVNSEFYKEYFTSHIVALSGQKLWVTKVENLETRVDHDPMIGEYREAIVHFELTPANEQNLRHFTFQYDAVVHQVITHQVLVFVQYDWENGILEESGSQPIGIIALDVPSGKINPLEISLEEGSWFTGVKGMFLLGMEHIREGLDHILFLLTLLLIAPLAIVNKRWSGYQGIKYTLQRFLKISLAFTVGHSVTLLAASFNLIDFRVQYIEVLIALSIFFSAINCIKPVFFKKEVLMAGGFGLIHGLAFSITLSGLELGFSSKLMSILSFNLGIETMQLIIMACFFPVLLCSKWKFYHGVRIGVAIVTMVVSIGWMAERISSQENFITSYLNAYFS